MNQPIIEIHNLSKRYKIGKKQESYQSLRDSISKIGKSLVGKSGNTFWALKDINLNIHAGECVGIIGRNGAGKSTLLKILSRITPPTKGSIKMRGRVASLLEVGTGFHPELTGRENIYLNGSILGMHRQEINTQFDEIVDFSGVEKFLDTPLKHYSSGMQLRLAFAVAAHLNPEILLIDEVLAVGDAEFQKKCLGKMDEVSKSGRTVIFVSHDLGAVKRLCKKGLLLSEGRTLGFDHIDTIIQKYESSITERQGFRQFKATKTILESFSVTDMALMNGAGEKSQTFSIGESMLIQIKFSNPHVRSMENIVFKLIFKNAMTGQTMFVCCNNHTGFIFNNNESYGTITCKIGRLPLNVGNYHIDVRSTSNHILSTDAKQLLPFQVIRGDFFRTGNSPSPSEGMLVQHQWY